MRNWDRDWAPAQGQALRPSCLAAKYELEIRLLAATPGCAAPVPVAAVSWQAGLRCVGLLGRCLSGPWSGRRDREG